MEETDMSEATAAGRHAPGFKLKNGETATVFIPSNKTTVTRCFKWIQDYGIGGE